MTKKKTSKAKTKMKTSSSPPIKDSIARITAFMKAAKMPLNIKNLAKGAAKAKVEAAYKKAGLTLPSELLELWLLHDGQREEQNGFLGFQDLLGHDEAIRIRADALSFVEFCREHPDTWKEAGVTKAEVMSDQWIPFGWRDSDLILVSGESGRVFDCGKDAPPLHLAAPSVRAWFARYAKQIDDGLYVVEDGFGDLYLSSISPETKEERELTKQATQSLPKLHAPIKAALGSFGTIQIEVAASDSDYVNLTIVHASKKTKNREDETALLRRALEANAHTLLLRHSVQDGGKLVSDCILPMKLAADKAVLAILKSELEGATSWKKEKLTSAIAADLHGKGGMWLTLKEPDSADANMRRVDGTHPIYGALFSKTWQMRSLVPIRAPQSASGLSILNDLNIDRENIQARVFIVNNQIGVACGTLLGKQTGYAAERAYWVVSKLCYDLQSHGAPEMTAALEEKLSQQARACLAALG